jgi:hypothetical protein
MDVDRRIWTLLSWSHPLQRQLDLQPPAPAAAHGTRYARPQTTGLAPRLRRTELRNFPTEAPKAQRFGGPGAPDPTSTIWRSRRGSSTMQRAHIAAMKMGGRGDLDLFGPGTILRFEPQS